MDQPSNGIRLSKLRFEPDGLVAVGESLVKHTFGPMSQSPTGVGLGQIWVVIKGPTIIHDGLFIFLLFIICLPSPGVGLNQRRIEANGITQGLRINSSVTYRVG